MFLLAHTPTVTPLIDLNQRQPTVQSHAATVTPTTIATREEWLNAAVGIFRPVFLAVAGATIPADVKVTCGWAAGKPSALGQCFPRAYSAASVNELFIAPSLDDAARVLDVLAHELIHAADDCASGHKGAFARIARALDMEGPLTATTAGPVLRATCDAIAAKLGPYPHARLDFSQRKKQTTRMLKHECDGCGAVWRMAAKWHVVACPCCAAPMAGADAGDADAGDADE